MDTGERNAVLAMLLTPRVGHGLAAKLIEAFGSATAAVEASPSQWAGVDRLSAERAGQLRRAVGKTLDGDAVEAELQRCEDHGVQVVGPADPAYPTLLGHIPDPPVLLWIRGALNDDDALGLGVVGSRRCTHYGREQAERFAGGGAQAGLCIVSGGAYGIDAAAARGALRVKGRTLAVIGSGLAEPYPKDHAKLFDEIVESDQGAVISEFPMQVAPKAENFPRRNRLISGMSLGVLVIEAAKRSGALITARLCVEDHGRELMAVPGRVDSNASAGCHKIIREGWATLVTSVADVLAALGETGRLLEVAQQHPVDAEHGPAHDAESSTDGSPAHEDDSPANSPSLVERNLSQSQRQIWAALDNPRSLDELTAVVDLPVQTIQSDLTMLEIRGSIQRTGGLFARQSHAR